MFTGQLVFIRATHRSGISKKTDKPYEFANATFSDGLESFTLDVNTRIMPLFDGLQKGDHVDVRLSVYEENGTTRYQVQHIEELVNA